MGSGETTQAETAAGLPPRSSRKRRGSKAAGAVRKTLRAFLVLAALVVAAAGIYAGFLLKRADDVLDSISGEAPAETEEQPKPKEEPVTILLLGLDSREATRTRNTDVIMAIALNPSQKKGTLVSIPRDMAMKPSGYKQNKANAFYAAALRYGKDKPGGPEALVKSMFGELLGVPVDYLVIVNFKAFEAVVDALGGIEVEVDMDMCYIDDADGTRIMLKKGRQTLGGKEALDFVRYRQSTAKCGEHRTKPSSDLERNRRQQQVVRAVLDKAVSLGGLARLTGLLKAIGDNVQTDIPKNRLLELMATYATLSSGDLESIALEGSWRSPYVIVPEDTLEAARQALRARLEAGGAEHPDRPEATKDAAFAR